MSSRLSNPGPRNLFFFFSPTKPVFHLLGHLREQWEAQHFLHLLKKRPSYRMTFKCYISDFVDYILVSWWFSLFLLMKNTEPDLKSRISAACF